MIAMTRLDRQTAADLLDSGGQHQHTPFNRSWLAHYQQERITFPLPAAGAQWIGVFNHEGVAKQYNASRHGRRMGHLVVNGGFLFNEDAAVNALQIATVYKALRIGLLANLLTTRERQQVPKDPGYNAVFCTRRMCIREAGRLRQQVTAYQDRQVRNFDRLNFIQALDVYGSDAIQTLQQCLAADAAETEVNSGIPEYYHTYNQMNKWFLFEMSKNVLWHKTYEQTRYMCDPDRPERYLTLESVSPLVVRQCLDSIKVMVENPGKPKPKYQNIYDAWIAHPRGNKVNAVVVNPLASDAPLINPYHIPNQFNSWRGWDFYSHGHYDDLHAKYHDKSLAQLLEIDAIRTINAFVYGMLCDQDTDAFRMITLILANVLQRPDSRPEKAVFLKGPEGVGKSLFSKSLVTRVFGLTHAAEFDRTEHIIGHFNEPATGKAFIVIEEALLADKETIGRFQQLVTGETQQINGKFKDVRLAKNISTLWGNSNQDTPIFANQNARRYVIVQVSPLVQFMNTRQKYGLFNRISSLLESDSVFLYAYFLARLPLEEWFLRRKATVMVNTELGKAKLHSLDHTKPVLSWLLACAQQRTFGKVEIRKDAPPVTISWNEAVPLRDLYDLFCKGRRYPLALMTFTHELMIYLGRVPGWDAKYQMDQRLATERGAANATWVKLPSYSDALPTLEARIAGVAEVGSVAAVAKQLEHEDKLIKVAEAPDVTVEQLLPEGCNDAETTMLELFGDLKKVVVPCQEEPK